MACPLFSDGPLCRCAAVRGRHTPTIFERERYCNGVPEACPTGRLYQLRGVPIDERDYWAIWLPDEGAIA